MFVVVFLVITCVVVSAHWYLWRRLVRDVSVPGGWWRRTGTVLAFAMPSLLVAAMITTRSDVPFALQRTLAWPGLMWFAVVVYLLLTLLVLEAVRPLVLRLLRRRDARRAGADGSERPAAEEAPAALATTGSAHADSAPDRPVTSVAGHTEPAGAADAAPPVEAALGPDSDPACGTATAVADKPATATAAPPADGASPGSDGTNNPDGTPERNGSHRLGTAAPTAPAPSETPATAGRGGCDGPADASRRRFVARAAAITAGTVATVTVGAGTHSVLAAGPKVKRVDVTLAKLPPAADGYRITLISDIHMSPVIGRGVTQRIVERANATDPDLIAIAGDLVDGQVKNLRGAAQPLGRLRAREGVFFATGNHEYYSGYEEWNSHLAGALGIRVLRNEREELRHFDIVGVNDLAGEEHGDAPDLPKALAGRDGKRPAVLIAHQPAMIDEAKQHGVDLQLSGHTHGGQMFPGNFLAALANPTLVGLERYGDTQLYVTRGAGSWGPPVRVGAEPDITVLTLRAGRS
ncbi:metallophosphoesterase [Streptomyces sp. P38-E01]|uniref:Metallophosphoesterase n=1 Tax=Streptomyces tardus TaxID=2780544 RepID=A0A949N206_9ACTN|nr:metallophosphoesterase [Streptomyces tardus]MBU7598430.1 metallophosphoesterase [Streptomyces tardus]